MDDHPRRHCARRQSTRQDWRPGRTGGWRGSDFNVLSRWVIPAWRRRCPRESWHVARCLREIIVSVKLLYSHKTFWCWLPRKCVNPHGSFVKLRLLSNQRCNWRIGGWVKMKQYRRQAADQWRRYTMTRQVLPKSELTPWLSPWLKLRESSFELVKLESVPSWKTKLRNRIFELRLTSFKLCKRQSADTNVLIGRYRLSAKQPIIGRYRLSADCRCISTLRNDRAARTWLAVGENHVTADFPHSNTLLQGQMP